MARTAAEGYFERRQQDPDYRAAYDRAARRINEIDELVRTIEDRRAELGISKAELARRADLPPEAVRRLFSVERPNPTAKTLVALADALDLEFRAVRRPRSREAPAGRR